MPSKESRDLGIAIKSELEARWSSPDYFCHLRRGGHVAALKVHATNNYFLHVDVQDFFGSISRNRVTRCLKPMFGFKKASYWAKQSAVFHPTLPGRTILPYGFVQSQVLASLCLADSALGRYLDSISRRKDIGLSVYVDDIIVSTCDEALLRGIDAELGIASDRSRFLLYRDIGKMPYREVSAFNVLLSEMTMRITPERMAKFADRLNGGAGIASREGIVSYVESICPEQAEELR